MMTSDNVFFANDYTIDTEEEKSLEKIGEDIEDIKKKLIKNKIDEFQVVIYIHGYTLGVISPYDTTKENSLNRRNKMDKFFQEFDNLDKLPEKMAGKIASSAPNRVVVSINIIWESHGNPNTVKENSKKANKYLHKLILCLTQNEIYNICIIAHSMGNYILINTISQLIDEIEDSNNEELTYDSINWSKMQFISCASAVDRKTMKEIILKLGKFGLNYCKFKQMVGINQRPKIYYDWTSYYHRDDRVLLAWQELDKEDDSIRVGLNHINKIAKFEFSYKVKSTITIDNPAFLGTVRTDRLMAQVAMPAATASESDNDKKEESKSQDIVIKDWMLMVQSIDCSNVDLSKSKSGDWIDQVSKHSYMDCPSLISDMKKLIIGKIIDPEKRSENHVYALFE